MEGLVQRILIIDDNVDAAQTLGALLQMMDDKDVHIANDGAHGLAMANELHPDVVLLDLLMPGMDGFEVARRLRQESWAANVFLVALSGWAQDSDQRKSREAGFDQHLSKPVELDTLEQVLRDPPVRQRAH